ncbi:MAG: DUF1801 domain-containing protein [Methyloceanibacter sp.]|nr:DUF1801 domain-containing protein [Methyloceanibacter sp.]
MLYNASTPQDYLAGLPDDWRKETLLQLRSLILQEDRDIREAIHYKMLGYGTGDRFVFHLNAQKGYVSLYAGNIRAVDPDGDLVAGLSTGKGCIRFTKTKSVPETRVDAFISRAIARWKAGHDDGC